MHEVLLAAPQGQSTVGVSGGLARIGLCVVRVPVNKAPLPAGRTQADAVSQKEMHSVTDYLTNISAK